MATIWVVQKMCLLLVKPFMIRWHIHNDVIKWKQMTTNHILILRQNHIANQCLYIFAKPSLHGVTMSTMVSQIISLTIVYSTVYSRCRSKKTSKLRVTGLCEGNSTMTSEFPAQRAINAKNGSIWWRHHVYPVFFSILFKNETESFKLSYRLQVRHHPDQVKR